MSDIYKYPNLNEIEVHPEFVRLQQMMSDVSKSIWESENEAKEKVSKVILNKLGYPNNVELFTYQNSNKAEFVDVKNSTVLACVDLVKDGRVFYVETKYFGDWYKWVF